MATVTIENPDVHKTQKVGNDGEVYLTTDLAGERVQVVAEQIDYDAVPADDLVELLVELKQDQATLGAADRLREIILDHTDCELADGLGVETEGGVDE